MYSASARELLTTMHAPDCVTVDDSRSHWFVPAVVCWTCEESIDLDENDDQIARFIGQHRHATADTDPTSDTCPRCHQTADQIGADTMGRPYWWCANCGAEYQTEPTA